MTKKLKASKKSKIIKTSNKIVKKIYPEYIQKFIKDVEAIPDLKVKVDQYTDGDTYSIGVNKKRGKVYHCIWTVGYVTGPEFLTPFWTYWNKSGT